MTTSLDQAIQRRWTEDQLLLSNLERAETLFANGVGTGKGVTVQEIPAQRFEEDVWATVLTRANAVAVEMVRASQTGLGNPTLEEKYQYLSLWDKGKVHAWAVVLLIESAYRTIVEAVAYVIHQMIPLWFPDYPLEERTLMLERLRQSTVVMAYAVVTPYDFESIDLGRGHIWKDDLQKLGGRGTPYGGHAITAPAYDSSRWPRCRVQEG